MVRSRGSPSECRPGVWYITLSPGIHVDVGVGYGLAGGASIIEANRKPVRSKAG
jgi:hypothetical protein